MKHALLILFVFGAASAQPIGFGVKGGFPLTDAFSDRTVRGVDTSTHYFSDSKGYILGPTAELRLPFGVSVEADALYRRLNLTTETTVFPSRVTRVSSDESSWEFPILAKVRLWHLAARPYVGFGPSFRTMSVSGVSHSGFAFSAGLELKALFIRLSPELRYNRWGSDSFSNPAVSPRSNQSQVEFLIGLTF